MRGESSSQGPRVEQIHSLLEGSVGKNTSRGCQQCLAPLLPGVPDPLLSGSLCKLPPELGMAINRHPQEDRTDRKSHIQFLTRSVTFSMFVAADCLPYLAYQGPAYPFPPLFRLDGYAIKCPGRFCLYKLLTIFCTALLLQQVSLVECIV